MSLDTTCWPCEARQAIVDAGFNPDFIPRVHTESEGRDTYRENLERARKHTKCKDCGSWNVSVHIPPTCALSQCHDCRSRNMAWDPEGRPDA